jgi:hypothetical protein
MVVQMVSDKQKSAHRSASTASTSLPKDLEKAVHHLGGEIETPDPPQTASVIDWNGPNDPDNPQTWSDSKKMYHILVPTILGFVV